MLQDKVAVIYGAGGAIGGAVARAFASEGAKVFSPAPPGLVLTKRTAMQHRTAEQSADAAEGGPIARESREHSDDHGARGAVVIVRWGLPELAQAIVELSAAKANPRPAPPDVVLELLEETW
jgi:NAD(P)-dependent dehydrogenase (short-subunit alcohol dehydrogenase family)